jgi:hypothetical protein
MVPRRSRSLTAIAGVGLLVAGCSGTGADGPSSSARDDAGTLVQQALDARSANDVAQFAALVSSAGKACADADAARRLGELAVIAGRWATAVQQGRPKQQATTEAQLAQVDWAALASSCGTP